MKYIAPEAELVLFEASSVILLSNLFCIVDGLGEETDEGGEGGGDKLPDFYG
ncbi:MAG: hypothetical protein IJN48_00340 [Clostridia bacterium]|nr:hypothetical protein [Clostridia bacterium]